MKVKKDTVFNVIFARTIQASTETQQITVPKGHDPDVYLSNYLDENKDSLGWITDDTSVEVLEAKKAK